MTTATPTYEFPNGDCAQTLDQFCQICEKQKEIAAEHLYQGYFEPSLRDAVLRPDLRDRAHDIRENVGDRLVGLELFLQIVRSTVLVGGPKRATEPLLQADAAACGGDLRVLTFA